MNQPTERKREVREVDKLAAQATENLRAVGTGNSFDEKYARTEAIQNAQVVLAGYIETTVMSITDEYHKNATVNGKKFSESDREGIVRTVVAQNVSTRMIGTPEIYDLVDGSVRVYVCAELTTRTVDVLGGVYDSLSREGVLGADFDKQQFIEKNKGMLDEMSRKLANQ